MEGRNVFVLSADSLAQRYFTEAARELANLVDGVRFTNAIATAPDTNSAIPGLAAGMYTDSVPGWGLPDENPPATLATCLHDTGYDTGLWSDNFLFGKEYNYHRGFKVGNQGKPSKKKQLAQRLKNSPVRHVFGVVEWAYFNVYKRLQSGISDDETFYKTAAELNAEVLNWLRDADGPNFCWVHYMDTHHPYEPPSEYLQRFPFNESWTRGELSHFTRQVIKNDGADATERELEDVRTAYEACCDYTKTELVEFVTRLLDEHHFVPGEDVLVITADHGECLFPERFEMMGHVPPTFWEDIVNVPLVISHPDWDAKTVDDQVSLIDVMPTVLDAVDVDIPETVEGTPRATPEEMVVEYARFASQWGDENQIYRGVRSADGWKAFGANLNDEKRLILTHGTGDDEEIRFRGREGDRPDGADAEKWNELEAAISSRGTFLENPSQDSGEVNNELEEHLRDLGYVE